ncbi:hypothetical protein A374_17844 [Fictibacillus macauensis ZFHKF-1]|uniref:Pseudouridine-5'-phosphate glycosidase n=1 Tax=Fictibacillus macauensis ZFHKF-1 TaxID=1196324 RepID=I8AEA4_9BACL|nr:pseudouridine-5'-phosphate glycosidase [Fictibacillus macauensis]EIT83922.1 hypothetical protein A374_17844 [Fictibacillus macauensis ZFHKF-1]
MKPFLSYTDEVKKALTEGLPVVALESTIISHGMPYPQNVEMALEVEQIIRDQGAIPATIGIMNGVIKIGLTREELEEFATNPYVEKVSRRDLPAVVASGKIGATTVAATMIAAKLAGIAVFATGGIGGVHRGGEVSMDISADLTELAQSDVAVVCAGVKSILDIGRTLEYLETQGVPVLGYQTSDFPSFFARESGFGVDVTCQTAEEAAQLLHTKWALGLQGGAVIANPVPTGYAMAFHEIEQVIVQALNDADEQQIAGKAVTPFLLNALKERTGGASLATNIALVKHNAFVAAEIAIAYSALKTTHQLA